MRPGTAIAAGVIAAATLLVGSPAAAADTVADLVFGADLLGELRAPVTIDYTFARDLPEPGVDYEAPVHMEVRKVAADGGKEVYFDLFEGADRRAFGPVAAARQNPLLLVFLQRDVHAMEQATGGSQHYFRNVIRAAFNAPATVETMAVEVDGRSLPARRVAIQPFAADPNIGRYPAYRDKTYIFTVAPELPGGLWQVASQTVDPQTGASLGSESMTYAGSRTFP